MNKYEFHDACKVTVLEGTKLRIVFDDGTAKVYDIKDWTKYNSIFKELENRELFKKAHILYGDAIIWNSRIDVDCDALYDEGTPCEAEEDDVLAVIGFQIAKARRAKHLTQKELSNLVGIKQGDISKLEKGRSNFSVKTLNKISKALNKDLVIKIG